jgi:predicted enzyme related to lactoylglutathione lyase
MGNPVTQWQVITREPEKHSAFYAVVFGWNIRSDNPFGYRMVDPDSAKGIPGGFWPAPPEAQAFVQLFIEVTDIEETVRQVTNNGGSVLIPPQTLPTGEQMAILRDPMGISFGLVVPGKQV